MKQQEKTKLGRRDFLRAIGAGAGLAVTAAAPLATEAAAYREQTLKRKRPVTRRTPPTYRPSTRSTVIRAEGG